jgi:hypothetical protein
MLGGRNIHSHVEADAGVRGVRVILANRLPVVSGMEASHMVFMTSTNGTPATTTLQARTDLHTYRQPSTRIRTYTHIRRDCQRSHNHSYGEYRSE